MGYDAFMKGRQILTAAAAVALLAGCGAATQHRSPTVVANLLGTSGTAALGTSFEAGYTATLSVALKGVSGLPPAAQQQLQQAVTKASGSAVTGTILYQADGTYEVTWSAPALMPETIHLLRVGGRRYVSLDGTQWYAVGSGPAAARPGGTGGLQTQLRRLLSTLRSATRVTDLGSGGEVNGVATEHLRAQVPGSALGAALSGAIASLGKAAGPPAGAAMLSQLLTFGATTVDGWVATSSHLPQRLTASSSATLDLGALALLGPSGTPAVTGSASLGLEMAVDFSHFGADFGLTKPTNVLPGSPQLPQSALSQFA